MSFRLKIILGIVAIQTLLLLLLVAGNLDFLRSSNEEELQKRADITARLFASATRDALLATDLASLESAVAEVVSNPDVVYARVLGMRGVLAQGGNPQVLALPFQADTRIDRVADGIFDVGAEIELLGVSYGRVEIGFSVDQINAVLRQARNQAIGIAIVAIALVILFSFALGLYLARSLDALTEGARRLSVGELGYQIGVRGKDELAQTARAFNDMSRGLQVAADARQRVEAELAGYHDHLEQLVAQRTAELTQTNAAMQQTNCALREVQNELLTTARQAGMAEIANNVLHNVGNVLNSVNISAGLINQQVRSSKTQGLAKAVELINAHPADLGHFLAEDEKGKMLPGYLNRLVEALAAERQDMLEELGRLGRSIEHIKDIVATQQSYAGATSAACLISPVQVEDLVEDALRMNAGALTRHEVTVVKDFAKVPMISLDRSRVLQILVNLISNAKQAMEGAACSSHRITLRLGVDEQAGGHRLWISVQDEGEGIAPENLARIFNHGFTTRPNGHGFGLHSCALAAREMGGQLIAYSAGLGQGASFTLELPITPPECSI